jgi:HEAT repeat protein
MTEEERKLTFGYLAGKITEGDFLRAFTVDPRETPNYIVRSLESSIENQSAADVEAVLGLGFRFKLFTEDTVPVLCRLLNAPWHRQHENVASALQGLKDPRSVEFLDRAMNTHFPYLDYDQAFALPVKCLWALSDINTAEARDKLKSMTESDNKIIRDNAQRLLERSLGKVGS